VTLQGIAEIVHEGKEHEHAIELLRQKYSQYLEMKLEKRPVIKIIPTKITGWRASASTR
jgi:hypothetical protein